MKKIADTNDLHISPFREDGVTYGTPTWIWSVVVEGEVYVRPCNGSGSRWYKAAMTKKAGRITAAGMIGTRTRTTSVRIAPRGGLRESA